MRRRKICFSGGAGNELKRMTQDVHGMTDNDYASGRSGGFAGVGADLKRHAVLIAYGDAR